MEKTEEILGIQSERLEIVAMTPAQLEEEISQNDEVKEQEQYRRMLNKAQENPENWGLFVPWTVSSKIDGTQIGVLTLTGDPADGIMDLKFSFDESHVRDGVASEAVRNFCQWVLAQKNLYYVDACADEKQSAWKRVLESSAFKRTKISARKIWYTTERQKVVYTALVAGVFVVLGIVIGLIRSDLVYGILLGALVGMAIGYVMDILDIRRRKVYKKKHEERIQKL